MFNELETSEAPEKLSNEKAFNKALISKSFAFHQENIFTL
jgi:hypothetical protein